jgi:putative PIN family toxin of toxin-antitoxin system
MRVMCDTNVLVRAVLTPQGAAGELLERLAQGHLLVTSAYQLTELLDVLRRPKIRTLHRRDERGIRRVIGRIYKLSAVVPLPADLPAVVVDDPKDDPIVMTAVTGQAEVLCTRDKHLHHTDVVSFCAGHGVRVLSDLDLLTELRAS